MPDQRPSPPFAAIVVAAGEGLRAGQPIPKQFASWCGKPVLRHSVETLVELDASPLVIAIPAGSEEMARDMLDGMGSIELVIGGATRQRSVAIALEAMAVSQPANVLIHDAARPVLPHEVVARIIAALADNAGAIPVLPVVDSLAVAEGGQMAGTAEREILRRVQTPQAFRYADILAAHRSWPGEPTAGDDAQVLRAAGGEIALVAGDERLAKLTFAEDFMDQIPAVRTGMGYDVHRLAQGEELWLGGIRIEHDRGLAGHSDADVALHALVDALLGAIGDGDIGSHFPPNDPQWKGARSSQFVEHAAGLIIDAGYAIGNIDLTIICEAPKIGPHREAMRRRVAELLAIGIERVSVKATTTERLGFAGRGEGIAAQAIATVIRN